MSISVRTRFEVFKRDKFTYQYCGRPSPDVSLRVDHIVAKKSRDGQRGSDDPINLITSCLECNGGKSNVPLGTILTGEDPEDRTIALFEQERQLKEYNVQLEASRARRLSEADELSDYWQGETNYYLTRRDHRWLQYTLRTCPREQIRLFMDKAVQRGFTDGLRWVIACVRNWHLDQRRPTAAVEPIESSDASPADDDLRTAALDRVTQTLREAEQWRRNIGYCPHDPPCASYVDCVLLQTHIWLGAKPGHQKANR